MTPLPLSAFPLCGANSKAGGFVLAVLVGLAFYLSQQSKQAHTSTPR